MERWSHQYGTTGNDTGTKPRQRRWTSFDLYDNGRHSNGVSSRSPGAAAWLLDPRIPARLARTASIDIAIEHGYDTHQQDNPDLTSTREISGNSIQSHHTDSAQSHDTNDSDWTKDADLGNTPVVDDPVVDDPVFPPTPNKENSKNLIPPPNMDMDVDELGEVDWKRRMSDFANNLPNFALGLTTREFTHRRRRLYSDNSNGYHDAVSLEKRSQRWRTRRGTTSSSGSDWSAEHQLPPDADGISRSRSSSRDDDTNSTFSRFSSCSSRDSIQHWVDSLDDNENDVTALPGQQQQGRGSRGPNVEYQGGVGLDNIPGQKKGSNVSLDDLSLGADASFISNGTSVPSGQTRPNGTTTDETPKVKRVGSGGRVLQRKLTNSQIIEQAQQHRTLQGRRQQLLHMGGSGVPDTPSDYSVRTASSIAELLLMRNDPEEILLALGFGGSKKNEHLDRIPSRFLQTSRMKGISVQEFLHRMEEIERGYGFNINGGLRGLEFVLDRQRTNSINRQNSGEEEPVKDQKTEEQHQDTVGNTSNKEPSPVEEPPRPPSPPVSKEPSLEEIYAQRQPPQLRRILDRWDSSLESLDSGPLFSSRDSTASENESFDIMSRSGSLENSNVRHRGDVGVKDGSVRPASSFPAKDVVQASACTQTSRESSIETDSTNVASSTPDGGADSNGNGALTEEQIAEIREELMLRAQIVRARMVIPPPQLPPVDEESETDARVSPPYRIGSLDTTAAEERMPDGSKVSPTTENASTPRDNRHRPSNMVRTMSTPTMDLNHQRNQKKSPPKHAKMSPGAHGSPVDDSNKLKPVPHKVADRLLKENGHGRQESFEIEEISSTENQDDSGSPSNKTGEKPSEHDTLSRNPSTQSDSSGFADEVDAPSNGANGNHSSSDATSPAVMTTTEVQTSFDTNRLDSYDRGSLSSQMNSLDTHVSEEDVRRLAERRESFRKSRGTSIITSATFSSFVSDDDAFLPDDVSDISYDGKRTPVDFTFDDNSQMASSKPRPLRRSGTFPGISTKSDPPTSPQLIPEIHTSFEESIQKSNLSRKDGASSPELASRQKQLLSSKTYSVDLQRYNASEFEDHLLKQLPNRANFDTNNSELKAATSNSAGAAPRTEPSNSQSFPVCDEEIVPSRIESETVIPERCKDEQRPQPDAIRRIDHNSTDIARKETFPQCLSPTLDQWDTSDVSSRSRTPDSEPFRNYSPLLSPPPSSSASVLPDDTKSPSPSEVHPRVWQVTDKSHHLEQRRIWPGSTNPVSSCVSELSARCEPYGEGAERLRSSLEIDISGNIEDKSLPDYERLHSQHWSTELVELSAEDKAENWQKVLATSTPVQIVDKKFTQVCMLWGSQTSLAQRMSAEDKAENWYKVLATSTPVQIVDKKFTQYNAEDVEVLQSALERYKHDLAELEAKSSHVYGSVEQELTESDRCELEALVRVRHQIMGEIATMEKLLRKKLQTVTSPSKQTLVVSDETELLAASAENLEIIREMISLLEEQRSMQQFIQDLNSQTQAFQFNMSGMSDVSTATASRDGGGGDHHDDSLVQELICVKRELEEYRVLAKKELKEAISEIRRKEEAKDDEIKRLRSLLGETDRLPDISQVSHPVNRYEETQRQKDELMQLKDLLLKRSSAVDSHKQDAQVQGELHRTRNGNR